MTFKIKDGLSVGGASFLDANRNIDVNDITLTGQIKGPATLVIDPAAVGDDTGLVQIRGNLQVDGTTTTINSTTLTVDDKNIVLADGQSTIANIDTAGIDFGSTAVKLKYYYNSNTNPGLSIEGTNVGIGVTAPASKLSIAGSFTDYTTGTFNLNQAVLSLYNTNVSGANQGSILAFNSKYNDNGTGTQEVVALIKGANDTWANDGAGNLQFYTSATGAANNLIERMRISSGGNVGIGTTAPGARLDILGAASAISNPQNGVLNIVDSTAAAAGVGGQIVFRGQYQSNTYTQYAAITAYKESATVDGSQYGASLIFNTRTQGGNNTEKMRIDSDGRVGIGTTGPLSRFVVNGGTVNTSTYTSAEARIADGSLHLMKTNAGGVFEAIRAINNDTTAGTTVRVLAASTSDPFNNGNGGKVFIDAIRTATNMDLTFSLNDTAGAAAVERVRFMGSGNVGIGATAPSEKLSVNGNVLIGTEGNTRVRILGAGGVTAIAEYYSTESNPRWAIGRDLYTSGQAGIGFGDTSNTIAAGGSAIGIPTTRTLAFATSNGTSLVERMRINASGDVGIGTTGPIARVDISAATPASDTALRIKSNTAFLSPDGNNTITARMLNTDTLSFSGNSGQLFSISDTMTGSIFAVNDISGMPSIEVYDTGQVRLAELSGNVLIGTATDNNTDKLQVTGSASFSTAITTNIFKQPQGTIAGNSATTTLNLNQYGNFYVNLSTNTALAFSNISSNIGSSGYIFLKQDGGGGRTITLPTEAKTPGGRAIVQVTTANSLSMITFYVVDASNVIVNYISDFKTPA